VHPRLSVRDSEAAFALPELLMATAITLLVTAAVFQLFHQSERLFRDEAIIVEMQQTARLLASQIADDIRIAGQSIPPGISEVVLPGSSASRLNIRAGFTGTETTAASNVPISLSVGGPVTVGVESTPGFSTNRQVFVFAGTDWARATINSVSGSAKTIRITPTTVSRSSLSLVTPVLSTDEAVSIYRDAALQVVRRTTSTNTENPSAPVWAPANELATNVTELTFQYYDMSGMTVMVETAAGRSQVSRIDTRITVRASTPLSDRSRPSYALNIRSLSRNLQLR
jgi:Tfp pilus assembly protein PilW